MKYFLYTLVVIAIGMIGFNTTFLNFENIFEQESKTAIIGVLAGFCVLAIAIILLISKKIEQKYKNVN